MTSDELLTLRRQVVVLGHQGDEPAVRPLLEHDDSVIRELALGALHRMGALTPDDLANAVGDKDRLVRRRVAELGAGYPTVDLAPLLADGESVVVETAVWSYGERVDVANNILNTIISLTTEHDDALVREAGAAALGAIGDERGVPAILTACTDKPAVRRRAVLALAPFSGSEIDAAIDTALNDRDWQVRQSAEDLRR
jgi:HEAT repeat protein